MPKLLGETTVYSRNMGLDLRQDPAGGRRPIYIGYAVPGSADNAAVWQIFKLAYDANNVITHKRWADGNDKFDKKWSLRTGYTFRDI